jgi:hypothetical protein
MELLKLLVSQNIEGVTAFIDRLLQHDGDINYQHLYKVVEQGETVQLVLGDASEKINHYAVLIGAESSNSFTPLYEISSLFRGLFLTGVGTAFLRRYESVVAGESVLDRDEIREMALRLEAIDLKAGVENPIISIVCDLDTDIEPYRYVKHQLWGLTEESLKKRCADITRDELLQAEIDTDLKDIYWVEQDWEITQRAIRSSKSLPEAKAIQFYLTGKIFLDKLGVDITKARLYFQFVPKEELMFLGPKSDVLSVLLSLHNAQSMKLLSKLLESKTPWIFSFSCPNCGESSKRVINSEFNKTFDSVQLKCSQSRREFRNEYGTLLTRQGCGHKWKVAIPQEPEQLFELLASSSFTVSCAIRELVRVIKTSSLSSICYVANSIGLQKCDQKFELIPGLPRGFGDHRKLMTSVFGLQHFMISGELNQEVSEGLLQRGLLKNREMQLVIRTSLDRLYDDDLECTDAEGLYVTDTSALKGLKKGQPVWDMFQRSIDVHEITLPELMKLKALDASHSQL